MRLDPIIAALRRRCPSFENRFAGAAEWAGLTEDEAPALPAAYVVPLAEDAGGNESRVGYQQTVTNTFAVIVLVSNVCDERGQKAFDSLEDLRLELFRAILSWQQDPPAEYSEIVYSGGQVLYMDDARLAFQFEFSFETYLDLSDTWQGVDLDELGPLEGADIRVDCVDPSTRKNQPDGKIEATLKVEL